MSQNAPYALSVVVSTLWEAGVLAWGTWPARWWAFTKWPLVNEGCLVMLRWLCSNATVCPLHFKPMMFTVVWWSWWEGRKWLQVPRTFLRQRSGPYFQTVVLMPAVQILMCPTSVCLTRISVVRSLCCWRTAVFLYQSEKQSENYHRKQHITYWDTIINNRS